MLSFRFRFQQPFGGYVLALQQVSGTWYALPIDELKPYAFLDKHEHTGLPLSHQGKPDQLVELDEPGYRSFVFMITQNEALFGFAEKVAKYDSVPPPVLDQLADWLSTEAGSYRVHWIGVSFRY